MTVSLDYIAGFFDGEGFASIGCSFESRAKYGFYLLPRVGISQSSHAILEEIQISLGYGGFSSSASLNGPMYQWTTSARGHVKLFLETLLPLLRVKRRVAELVLRALPLMSPDMSKDDARQVIDIIEQLRAENGHGVDKKIRMTVEEMHRYIDAFDESEYRLCRRDIEFDRLRGFRAIVERKLNARVSAECKTCGKIMSLPPSLVRRKTYCSDLCMNTFIPALAVTDFRAAPYTYDVLRSLGIVSRDLNGTTVNV